MKLIKEILFASCLTLGSLYGMAASHAHEMKLGNLVIEHPWTRKSPMGADVMAGFMKITNMGTEDDRLLRATIDITQTVQLHDMKMEGDVMKMVEIPEGIPIPAGKTVELKPKSLHVMFMEIESLPNVGEEIEGTLVFEKAGTVKIDYEVMKPDAGMN